MNLWEAVRASLGLLDRRDRRLLGLAIALQMATALLDLFGVVLIGVLGGLSVASVGTQTPPHIVTMAVSAFGLGGLSFTTLILTVAAAAAALLLTKSLVGPLVMARVFKFLARREAIVSARLSQDLLSRPLVFVHRRSSQETATALVEGVDFAIVYVLGQMVVGVSEAALLLLLAVVLVLASPAVALGAVFFFFLVGAGLQRALGRQAARLGSERMEAGVASYSAVQEAIGAYRELTVSNRRPFYIARIRELRGQQARASAGLQLVHILPKYILEGALVLGAFVLAGVLFSTQNVAVAVSTFALFLAAATRVMPSLLRLQAATLTMRAAAGQAKLTYALARDLGHPLAVPEAGEVDETTQEALNRVYPDFVPSVNLEDVVFTYPEAQVPAIQRLSLRIGVGDSVALIGSSGAGKSTVADLILGVLEPDAGAVKLGGLRPADAVKRWPGCIAYVPQHVMLANDSVRANVALGLPREIVDDELVWEALERAQVADYLRYQPDGLDTQVGERGLRLSGGQRQRLGIARALFTRPRLLVLDEATSALDAETENAIAKMLAELDADVTTVIVAHRLSTIRHVDLVVYLEGGKILAQGTFGQVFDRVPALQRQAKLMGLGLT